MNTRILTILLLAGFMITLTLTSCTKKEGRANPSAITKNEKGEVLTPEQRKWKKDVIGKEVSLHNEVRDSLINGLDIEIFGDQLYLSDYGDMRIKKFMMAGKHLNNYGKKGKGPGEFQQLLDFIVQKDTLYVLDGRKMEMLLFGSQSSDFITSHSLNSYTYGLASLDDRLIMESSRNEKLFATSDYEGNIQHRFGEFMDDQLQNGISVSGHMEAISDTGFVFSPTFASYLYYFNKEGSQTKVVRTVDRIPFREPEMVESGDMKVFIPPSVKVNSSGLTSVKNDLYILQSFRKESEELPDSFLDVYSLDTGQYRYSIKLPFSVRDVELTDWGLYVIEKETGYVKAFEYNVN